MFRSWNPQAAMLSISTRRHFSPHMDPDHFPGQAVVCAIYRHAGIRAVEIGSLMFGGDGHASEMELARLAIPRKVYTRSHIDYVVESILEVHARRDTIRPLKIVEEPPQLRRFTAGLIEIGE